MLAFETFQDIESCSISQKDFKRLSRFIYDECGINLSDAKKTMLEVRLRKRLKKLNMRSYSEYCEYLFSQEGDKEFNDMIDQVTTNKTDFFRESSHFEYMIQKVVPELQRIKRNLTLWSAGCSSGEEPYTMAMFLKEYGCEFKIFATDISTRVLEKGKLAVYNEERVQPVPHNFMKKYMLIKKDRAEIIYRLAPEVRSHVFFKRLNFMDNDYGLNEKMDIIFCRNVIIYFDRKTQEKILQKISSYLQPHGYLFMGHSETLFGMDVPLVQVAPTIYRRR